MNIIDRVLGSIHLVRKSVSSSTKQSIFGWMIDRQSPVKQPYKEISWVYVAISGIAENIAGVAFNLIEEAMKNGKPEKVVQETGALYRLFTNPNPLMTKSRLWEATLTFLGLRGEAMWIVERDDPKKIPLFIYCFDPDMFTHVVDPKTRQLTGWIYTNGTVKAAFRPWEVIHFTYFNPYDAIRGLSPIAAAQMGIDQDYYANMYNRAFFQRGAKVAGVVETGNEAEMTDAQFQRFRDQLNTQGQSAHGFLILEGGATFKEAKLSQKDMDFILQSKKNREEIFAVFKTNSVFHGMYEDVKSYEGQKTANQTVWRQCLLPKMRIIEETLWAKFFSVVDTQNQWGAFDITQVEALREDYAKLVETAERMKNMGWPINSINRRLNLGMEDVPWGNEWWAPLGVLPVSMVIDQATAEAAATAETGKLFRRLGITCPRCGSVMRKIPDGAMGYLGCLACGYDPAFPYKALPGSQNALIIPATVNQDSTPTKYALTHKQKEAIWKAYLKIQGPVEKKMQGKIARYFFEQRVRVLKAFYARYKRSASMTLESPMDLEGYKSVKDLTDDLFNDKAETELLKKVMEPLYQLAYKTGAESIASQLGDTGFVFNPLDPAYLKYANKRLDKILKDIVMTVKEQLRDQISNGITSGENVTQIAERIKQVYKMADGRSITIARTESGTMINGGRQQQMKNEGVEETEWLTAQDENVRESHDLLDGQKAPVGKKFVDKNGKKTKLAYPNDPAAPAKEVVNCRCVTLPVAKEEKEVERWIVCLEKFALYRVPEILDQAA